MGYILYGRRQTGSMAVQAALDLVGVDWSFRLTPRPSTEAELAALQSVNPRAQVPILIHPDGTIITEGPAILLHLADAFPAAGLAPIPGTSARAWHDRWLAFYQANVYEGMLRELFPDRYTNDATSAPAVATAATAYVRDHFVIFEAEITRRPATPFFCGERPAVLDIYIWMLCFWMDADWLAANCPMLTAHWHRMRAIPTLRAVEAEHFG